MREKQIIPDILDFTRENYSDRTALARKENGVWNEVTYGELSLRVSKATKGLYELGIRPGDRLALMLGNAPEWAIVDFACQSLGVASVPLYQTIADEQALHILTDSGAKAVLVAGNDQFEKLSRIAKDIPAEIVISVDEGRDAIPGKKMITYAELLQTGADAPESTGQAVAAVRSALQPETLASIIYTSGTTGMPKGVMLTQGNFMNNIKGVLTVVDIGYLDRHLSFLPLSHVFERTGDYLLYSLGAAIFYAESMEKIAENIQEIKPSVVISVPRLFEKMLAKIKLAASMGSPLKHKLFNWAIDVGGRANDPNNPDRGSLALTLQHAIADKLVFSKIRQKFGGRIRYFISGGAALSAEVSIFFRAIGIKVLEGYGLTETSPVIAVNPPDGIRPGTVGKKLPNLEVKLASDGELCVKGPSVTKGYYNLPDKTAEAFDGDGWFLTGDIAEISEDGYIKITDRKKDILVMSNGKNVAPQTIESRLSAHEFIAQTVVIGSNRNFITALIVPDFDRLKRWANENGIPASSNEQAVCLPEIEALYRDIIHDEMRHFAKFEQIKKFTLLPRELSEAEGELTPTLKIKRKVVDQKYAGQIEAMYSGNETTEAFNLPKD